MIPISRNHLGERDKKIFSTPLLKKFVTSYVPTLSEKHYKFQRF